MAEKKYVDYVCLVGIYGLSREFSFYCKKHRNLSLRRNARNFLLKKGYFDVLKIYRNQGFNGTSDMIQIVNTAWVTDRDGNLISRVKKV